MRKTSVFVSLLAVSLLVAGCAGPERKLGRGLGNMGEIARMGELQRSYEQAAVFNGPNYAATTGVIHGIDRTLARFGSGVYETLTFPIPNHKGGDYGPVFFPEGPVYPDSYKPSLSAHQVTSPDANLGFGGGDIAPFVPGSRFRVFEN